MCLAAPTWGPTWTSSRGSDQRAATPAPAAQPRPSPAAPFRIPGSLASPRTSPSLLPWPRRRPPAAVQAMVEVLRAGGCASLRCVAIQLPAEAPLRALHLDGCRQLAEVLVVASRLESLNLSHCGQLRSLTLRCRWGVRRHDRLAPRWVPPSLWLVTLPSSLPSPTPRAPAHPTHWLRPDLRMHPLPPRLPPTGAGACASCALSTAAASPCPPASCAAQRWRRSTCLGAASWTRKAGALLPPPLPPLPPRLPLA